MKMKIDYGKTFPHIITKMIYFISKIPLQENIHTDLRSNAHPTFFSDEKQICKKCLYLVLLVVKFLKY